MTSDEARSIAGKLTKAQRRFVESPNPEWAYVWNAHAVQSVISKGLGEPITSHCFRLTPLGLAVRAHLEQERGE